METINTNANELSRNTFSNITVPILFTSFHTFLLEVLSYILFLHELFVSKSHNKNKTFNMNFKQGVNKHSSKAV